MHPVVAMSHHKCVADGERKRKHCQAYETDEWDSGANVHALTQFA